MEETPSQGIYKCLVHGCFVHPLDGVVLPWAWCPAECMTLDLAQNKLVPVPCGLKSMLANQDDIKLDKKLDAMDDKTWEAFKETIHKLRAQSKIDGEKSMYGRRWQSIGANPDYRQLATSTMEDVIQKQQAEDKRVIREMFETIEREKMKLAMIAEGIELNLNEEN